MPSHHHSHPQEGSHDTHLSLANFRRHRRRLHKRLPGRRHGHASEHHGPPVRHLAGKDHHSNVAARVLGKAVDMAGHTRKKKVRGGGGHQSVHCSVGMRKEAGNAWEVQGVSGV